MRLVRYPRGRNRVLNGTFAGNKIRVGLCIRKIDEFKKLKIPLHNLLEKRSSRFVNKSDILFAFCFL